MGAVRYVFEHTEPRVPAIRLPQYFVCALATELPSVDVRQGDIAYAKDTDQFYRRTSSAWTIVGATFPLLAPNGSAAAPSYSFTNQPRAGMYLISAAAMGVTGGNASGTDQAGTELDLYAGAGTGTGVGGNLQLLVAMPAAASSSSSNAYGVIMSVAGNTAATTVGGLTLASHISPGGVTIRGHLRSGTDQSGGVAAIEGGRGTGAGSGGQVQIRTAPPSTSSGSSLNALQDAINISHNVAGPGRIVIGGLDVQGSPAICQYLGTDRAAGVSNSSGGDVWIGGGESTGSAAGGTVNILTSAAGGAGSAQNARAIRWTWNSPGHYVPAADITYDIGATATRV